MFTTTLAEVRHGAAQWNRARCILLDFVESYAVAKIKARMGRKRRIRTPLNMHPLDEWRTSFVSVRARVCKRNRIGRHSTMV